MDEQSTLSENEVRALVWTAWALGFMILVITLVLNDAGLKGFWAEKMADGGLYWKAVSMELGRRSGEEWGQAFIEAMFMLGMIGGLLWSCAVKNIIYDAWLALTASLLLLAPIVYPNVGFVFGLLIILGVVVVPMIWGIIERRSK